MGNTSCCCSSSPSNEDYQDLINKLDTVKDMSGVDQLISYIDQLLKAIDQQRHVAPTAQVDSSVNSVGGLLEKILKRSATHICKRDVIPNLNRETRKFAIDVTNQAAKIQWVGITLSVVGFVLERVDQISSNKDECMKLIRYMFDLAKHIKQLDEHLGPDKLNRIIQFIVEGCLMCLSQMKSHALSKFFAAPVAAEDLRKFQAELGHNYQDLSLEAITEVLNRIPVVLPPSQGIPPQTVGFEGAVNQVTQLLNMKGGSVRVVVIYGQGGIGKTTLATSVFSKLDLIDYNHCRVVMEQNCSEADLKLLQHQILRDLFGSNIELRSLTEGQEELSKTFKKPQSQPVFIFIDNALKQSDLEKLLPITDLSFLPTHSRILITTRNLSEAEIILQANIEFHSYPIASLQQEEAQKLLCQFALENGQANFDPTIDVQGLLQICQGIPLVLKIAGAKLRPHAHNVRSCREMVKHLESSLLDGGKGEISERMVDFVYDRLDASCKEAFLDIVFFFHNWEQSKVVFSVGEIEFQELEKAALVNITDENIVNVHDIVKARGRMLSPENGERITDLESLTDVERIKKTKGICLSGDFELEASHLNLMKKSLRVLILTEGAEIINGECNGAFENLRLLSLDNDNNYSQMDVSKHQSLAVLILRYKASNFPKVASMASSLKYVFIKNATLVNFTTILSQFQTLRSLALSNCRGFESLPESFGNLSSLQKLDLRKCSSLVSLSNNFGSLVGLVEIDLYKCSNLTNLPESFGNLSSLQKLDLTSCSSLVSLSNNFGSLVGLVDLYLEGCAQLSVLPESLGNLRSLEKLELLNCEKLSNLPQNFGHLKCLKYLSIAGCSELQSLSGDFECLSSLVAVSARTCSQLEENTMDKLAKMKGLMIVHIYESPMLERRWEQVKDQYSLLVLTQAYKYYSHEDVMRRAFFHRESKFLHVDENEQFGESPCPAVGVKLCFLLTACDLTSTSNSGYLEAVKRKWREAGSPSEEEVGSVPDRAVQMILVEVGSSWEESERRARETLPLLPRGTTAWIAPDTRARMHFTFSLFWASTNFYWGTEDIKDIIVSISTSVDEEGRSQMEFVSRYHIPYVEGIENRDSCQKILSPISEAREFLRMFS